MAIDLFSLRMNLLTTGMGTATTELKGVETAGIKTAASLNTVAAEVKGVEMAALPAASGISKMGLAIGGLVTAGLIGAAALVFVKSSIKDAADSENSWVGLRIAVLNAGLSFRDLRPQLDAIAQGIQRTTVFSDEAAREGLAKLIVATGDVTTAQRLLNIAVDLAAFKHIDLSTAAEMVGRVFNGNLRVLKEFGITTKDSAEALNQLEAKLRGAADAAGGTFTGATIKLANAWSEVKEAVGNFVLHSGITEFIQNTTREVMTLANWLDKIGGFLEPQKKRIGNATSGQLGSELQMLRNQAAALPAQVGNPSIGLPMHPNPALADNLERQKVIQRELVSREVERAQAGAAIQSSAEGTVKALKAQKATLEDYNQLVRMAGAPIDNPADLGDPHVGRGVAPRNDRIDVSGTLHAPSMEGSNRRSDASNRVYEDMLRSGETASYQFAILGQNLGRTLADGLAAGMGAAIKDKNPFKAFGNIVLQGLGSIMTQMGGALMTYGITMLKLLPFLTNIFTSGPAAIAAGLALTVLGTALGAAASGGGGGGGGGGGFASRDQITQIHLTANGAGGLIAPQAKDPLHVTIIGAHDPALHRQLAETLRNAKRSGNRF